MSAKKPFARFLILGCGLKKLHGGFLQRTVRSLLDEIDFQNFREQHACREAKDRDELFKLAHENVRPPGPVTYLEFGVHQGSSIKKWMELNTDGNSRFFGFDSFEGLPEEWNQEKGKGFFNVGGKLFPKSIDPASDLYQRMVRPDRSQVRKRF